jgi:hypothetical protein
MKKPAQPMAFKSIPEFLHYLPEDQLQMVEALRNLVLECIPDGTEKLAYNVPFYYRYSRICFIWPAAVPWGAVKNGVQIGFCKGSLLSDTAYLTADGRRSVFVKQFDSLKEIDAGRMRALLYEAVLIDETTRPKHKTFSYLHGPSGTGMGF